MYITEVLINSKISLAVDKCDLQIPGFDSSKSSRSFCCRGAVTYIRKNLKTYQYILLKLAVKHMLIVKYL